MRLRPGGEPLPMLSLSGPRGPAASKVPASLHVSLPQPLPHLLLLLSYLLLLFALVSRRGAGRLGRASDAERKMIDKWLKKQSRVLNEYGDPVGTRYILPPLWNPSRQIKEDRYDIIMAKHPEAPWEEEDDSPERTVLKRADVWHGSEAWMEAEDAFVALNKKRLAKTILRLKRVINCTRIKNRAEGKKQYELYATAWVLTPIQNRQMRTHLDLRSLRKHEHSPEVRCYKLKMIKREYDTTGLLVSFMEVPPPAKMTRKEEEDLLLTPPETEEQDETPAEFAERLRETFDVRNTAQYKQDPIYREWVHKKFDEGFMLARSSQSSWKRQRS